MRIVYFGSGEFGLPTLRLLRERFEVVGVVSQPDRPAGRHRRLAPTAIAAWAEGQRLPVIKADDANVPEVVERVRAMRPDIGVVIAFGQKLSPALIASAGRLAINLHASLLPRFRGAAPINWAMIHGEYETGNSVIGLAQRMDAGLIYGQQRTVIDPLETAGELHDRLSAMGPELVERVLRDFEAGTLSGQPQDDTRVSRAPKLSKADARVDFAQDCHFVRARIHGLNPWPGVRVTWKRRGEPADAPGRELHLLRVKAQPDLSCFIGHSAEPKPGTILEGHSVAVRDGTVRLLEVQLPGGKAMTIEEFVKGHPMGVGDVLISDL